MGLMEGTLESFVNSRGGRLEPLAECVFLHMLRALDFLACNGIVHRDVEPANILYITLPSGQYQFQLGDFGLCNYAISAATSCGSPIYMAPEMFCKGGQTSKADVWSLFVTMLWRLDVGEFRKNCDQFEYTADAQDTVLSASKMSDVSKIREMAIVNPEKRASAAQMLVKCFNGKGLTTPRNQVPALISSLSPRNPQCWYSGPNTSSAHTSTCTNTTEGAKYNRSRCSVLY